MTTVHDSIAVQLATLEQENEIPISPFGYGSDLSCIFDIEPDARELDDFSLSAVGQAALRRLITPPGALPDAPEELTVDVRTWIHKGMTPQDLQARAGEGKAAVEADDRVDTAALVLDPREGGALRITITITPADPDLGTFDLVLAVNANGQVFVETLGS